MKFENEKEFQIWLGRKLVEQGFEVYTDRDICELPTFKGDREKPDLLVFYKNNFRGNKVLEICSPFAIEIKFNEKNNKFNNLSKSILQIKKYKSLNDRVLRKNSVYNNERFLYFMAFYIIFGHIINESTHIQQ